LDPQDSKAQLCLAVLSRSAFSTGIITLEYFVSRRTKYLVLNGRLREEGFALVSQSYHLRYSSIASIKKSIQSIDRSPHGLVPDIECCFNKAATLSVNHHTYLIRVSKLSMSRKRARSRSRSPNLSLSTFKSAPIEDRSSTFVAVYSPTLSAKELQTLPEFKSATHRVAAWRKLSSQRSLNSQPLFETGHDDDGETYGGKAVEKVLVSMDVQGAVVVARWFGGVMLGPVRFEHMRNCAHEAVRMWVTEEEGRVKRVKVEEDGREKERLVGVLGERDESITVLRGLLAEKTRAASSQDSADNSAAKVPDYSTLPLATLQKLEQVRDKTIGWVLKKIEEAEEAQQKEPKPTLPKDCNASTQASNALTLAEDSRVGSPEGEKTDPDPLHSESG